MSLVYKIRKESFSISYGKREIFGFIKPEDFLKVTPEVDFEEVIFSNKLTSVEYHKLAIQKFKPLNIPILYVSSRGKIEGHEGRHRAKACIELNIKEMPVLLRIENYIPFKDKYGFYDYNFLHTLENLSSKSIVEKILEKQGSDLSYLNEDIFEIKANYLYCIVIPENSNIKSKVKFKIRFC